MPTPRAVEEHYRSQQRLIVATLGLTRSAWSRMGEDFDSSWRSVRPLLAVVVARAQLGAATAGAAYIGPALVEVGTPVDPVAEVVPRAFAGVASDGRPLTGLLDGAVVTAKDAMAAGVAVREALATGGRWLDMAVHTQVADAARGAAGVAITSRPTVGYVRMLNPPSCSRCAVLAGKKFYKNAGFERHPRCDCRHVPCTEDVADDLRTDPKAYFDSLDEAEQNRIFTNAGAQAIRDGADMGRVVNARRGMNTAAGPSGRSRLVRDKRGDFKVGSRLMPESIYERATDRDDAIRLLRANGFIR